MTERVESDICVIGAGAGGLSVAAGAALMGARVVLVEKAAMGGDCLNFGCVPSKAMIAAAAAAHAIGQSGQFGIKSTGAEVDYAQVHDHIHGVIAGIAPNDSVERYEAMGVRVIRSAAKFISRSELSAGGITIRARRFVVATGSRPAVPTLPGLEGVGYFTNESFFGLKERPGHLIIIGGGPIGVELAQAQRRLGASVSLVEMFKLLGREDAHAADVVRRRLLAEGVEIFEGVGVGRVEAMGGGVRLTLEGDGPATIEGSHLLVATGRLANVDGLGLEAAGVAHSPKGIQVNARLQTSNRRVYAVGDVTGGLQFTHVASYQANIVLRNVLFALPARAKTRAVPRVTYTDPELAQVGLTEDEARAKFGRVQVLSHAVAENDRARTEHGQEGFIKVVVGARGRILGATIVASHAGELILPWVLAMGEGLKIGAMAGLVAPYPTLGEISKRAAGNYFAPRLFSERTRRFVGFLQRFLP